MGNDGGSIPTRRELVKSAARAPTVSELKVTALESQTFAWTHDPVTTDPLELENVVSDWRGRLYNYETILQGLLPDPGGEGGEQQQPQQPRAALGDGIPFASTNIKSLRDVVKLSFKRYEAPAGGSSGGGGSSTDNKKTAVWVCPLSQKELGPATKSAYLVPCGHVFAEAAISSVADDLVCPECGTAFAKRDLVTVLPTESADLERLERRLAELGEAGLTHSLKKRSDKKKGKSNKRSAGDEVTETGTEADAKPKKHRIAADALPKAANGSIASRVSGINNAAAASIAAKVLAEQDERLKRRKLAAEAR